MSKQINDAVVVSVDIRGDKCIVIVGKRRDNGEMQIVNAFEGNEAKDLWSKLTIRKGEPRCL